MGGSVRLAVGRALHARYQQAAVESDPSCRCEAPLALVIQQGGWQVRIAGRADTLRRASDGHWLVEELKSFWPDLPPALPIRAAYRRQAALYAFMWVRESGEPTRAELVWLPVRVEEPGDDLTGAGPTLATACDATAPERESVELDEDAMHCAVVEAVDQWIQRIESQQALAARRAAAAPQVRFPHGALRPGQEVLMEAVERALLEREHLLIEAPTGLGKTAAVLTPALRYALRENKRLFVLTSTGLQQRMAIAVLKQIAPGELPGAVQIRAKARMCLNDHIECHEAACDFARDFGEKIDQGGLIARCFEDRSVVEPERLLELGRAARACPFELGLLAARRATVTVADYNYVFDPVVRMLHEESEDLAETILVVDELHNAPGRARDAQTASLDGACVARAARVASLGGAPVHREQAILCGQLLSQLNQAVSDCGFAPSEVPDEPLSQQDQAQRDWEVDHPLSPDLFDALLPRFERTFLATLSYRQATRSVDPDDPFVALHFELRRFADSLADGRPGFVSTVGFRNGAPRLRHLCLDPSRELAPLLRKCHAVIGLSATLSPAEVHRDALGLDPDRFATVQIPDPFPRENRRLVIDPRVDTRWARRGRAAPRIARGLAELAAAVPGHCLALLSSHAFLAEVRDQLPALERRLLWQRPDDGPGERLALLDSLESGPNSLLLAVAGGVFAEGLELPGDRLRAIAVVGPCLPAADLERRRLEAYQEERSGRGFEITYAIPGMTRVVQAGGRLIRSPTDRGVIALLGRRFLQSPYREAIPESWLCGGEPEDWVGDPAAVATSFFAPSG